MTGLQQSIQQIVNQQNSKIIRSDDLSSYNIDLANRYLFTVDEEGRYHSYNDEPAIVYMDTDIKIWMEHGKPFKKNAYSVITIQGKYLFDNKLSDIEKMDENLLKLLYSRISITNNLDWDNFHNDSDILCLFHNLIPDKYNINPHLYNSVMYFIFNDGMISGFNKEGIREYKNKLFYLRNYYNSNTNEDFDYINYDYDKLLDLYDGILDKIKDKSPHDYKDVTEINGNGTKMFLTSNDIIDIKNNLDILFPNCKELSYLLNLNNITLDFIKDLYLQFLNNYFDIVKEFLICHIIENFSSYNKITINNFVSINNGYGDLKIYICPNIFKIYTKYEKIYMCITNCNKCNNDIDEYKTINNKYYCYNCYKKINEV